MAASMRTLINVVTVQSLLKAVDAAEQCYSMDLAEPVIEEYKREFLCEDRHADRWCRWLRRPAAPDRRRQDGST